MPLDDRTSTLGPAVFIGLMVYALATYTPAEIVYANPADKMDTGVISKADTVPPPAELVLAALPPKPLPEPQLTRPARSSRATETGADRQVATLPAPPARVTVSLKASVPDAPVADTPPRLAMLAPFDVLLALQGPLRPQPTSHEESFAALESPARVSVQTSGAEQIAPAEGQTPRALPLHRPPAMILRGPTRPLRPSRSSAPSSPMAALPKLTLVGDFVNLRRQPRASSRSLGKFDSGTKAVLVDRQGNWARIFLPAQTPPITGWMYAPYLADSLKDAQTGN
ncbi:SH3 domain-containing protein [Shimia sp. CNT1-13L.2]|uniref:SH3 domain-containing protein n=1 Tax=Shimia sp. CNT1-13L.2 TaxID=2959663 RepID=UPI0020CBC07D|nr:SH3 domain-containing protein [Shimia sp. CNT1-13L.2]MCP9482113.1 SH3 domain-containing protein [Shimia sp. CNT1-13L.2]